MLHLQQVGKTNITDFVRAEEMPDHINRYTISIQDSIFPVYIWAEGKTVKWWSAAKKCICWR